MIQFHATTICAVRRGPNDVAIAGDGQVTMGESTIMKNGAKKVRKKQIVTSQQSHPKITKTNLKSFSIMRQNSLKTLKLYFFII